MKKRGSVDMLGTEGDFVAGQANGDDVF